MTTVVKKTHVTSMFEAWKIFRSGIMEGSPNATPEEINKCMTPFYVGAFSFLAIKRGLAENDQLDDAQRDEIHDNVVAELDAFMEAMAAKAAGKTH